MYLYLNCTHYFCFYTYAFIICMYMFVYSADSHVSISRLLMAELCDAGAWATYDICVMCNVESRHF